nr:uncharacterized protein LOC116765451 [Danaus plexippus plexippus]XP_032510779.1 uncharacterized protein LOC116765451 [Danaus plexippus plexippus]XP_032510781.1 uncharacterized protein LOC116765452 [Danaus plexippus plexippus]XP_032510782.1 uncharacterized protein LOC116765452 [Danaus plexippus plexippus]
MEDVELLAATSLSLLSFYCYANNLNKRKIKKRRKPRRWWLLSIHRNRTPQSMEIMFQNMLNEDSDEFKNFCRMSPNDFDFLLSKVEPLITKQKTRLRVPIPAKVRLALTLRFLATGDSYRSLHHLFKISSAAITFIIQEVCTAINTVLKDQIKMPRTTTEWLNIESGFSRKYPHCVGCIDGKHVVIQCPINSGTEKYKGTYSFVLLALVDSNYCFIFADIGAQDRISDGGIFQNSVLWEKISTGTINLPPDSPLSDGQCNMPHVFLGDGAFALSKHVMIPFPGNHVMGSLQRTFNMRLSSARVVVENVFGLLTTVFRIFKKPMEIKKDKAKLITMTCILLHNFLRNSRTSRDIYTPRGTFDTVVDGEIMNEGSWRRNVCTNQAIRPIPVVDSRASQSAILIRNEFASFFLKQNC